MGSGNNARDLRAQPGVLDHKLWDRDQQPEIGLYHLLWCHLCGGRDNNMSPSVRLRRKHISLRPWSCLFHPKIDLCFFVAGKKMEEVQKTYFWRRKTEPNTPPKERLWYLRHLPTWWRLRPCFTDSFCSSPSDNRRKAVTDCLCFHHIQRCTSIWANSPSYLHA